MTARSPSLRTVSGWILSRPETLTEPEQLQLKAVRTHTLPWSSGAVEGHVHRIKMIKRQMFGRAGFNLLRKRVLLA